MHTIHCIPAAELPGASPKAGRAEPSCAAVEHNSVDINSSGTFEDLGSLFIGEKELNTFLTDFISKIGENIQIISYKKYNFENSIFIIYLHNKYNSSCSKIASVVEIASNDPKKASDLSDQLKVIAMQVSAMKPMGLDENSLDAKILNDEKDIILKQIENTPDDKKEQIDLNSNNNNLI